MVGISDVGDKRAGKVADITFEPVSGPHPAFSLVLHTGAGLADTPCQCKKHSSYCKDSDCLRITTGVMKHRGLQRFGEERVYFAYTPTS